MKFDLGRPPERRKATNRKSRFSWLRPETLRIAFGVLRCIAAALRIIDVIVNLFSR